MSIIRLKTPQFIVWLITSLQVYKRGSIFSFLLVWWQFPTKWQSSLSIIASVLCFQELLLNIQRDDSIVCYTFAWVSLASAESHENLSSSSVAKTSPMNSSRWERPTVLVFYLVSFLFHVSVARTFSILARISQSTKNAIPITDSRNLLKMRLVLPLTIVSSILKL